MWKRHDDISTMHTWLWNEPFWMGNYFAASKLRNGLQITWKTLSNLNSGPIRVTLRKATVENKTFWLWQMLKDIFPESWQIYDWTILFCWEWKKKMVNMEEGCGQVERKRGKKPERSSFVPWQVLKSYHSMLLLWSHSTENNNDHWVRIPEIQACTSCQWKVPKQRKIKVRNRIQYNE